MRNTRILLIVGLFTVAAMGCGTDKQKDDADNGGTAGETTSGTGGKATGGSSAKATGGTSSTGGSSAKATGGTSSTGGSSATATGGTNSTGGTSSTGGSSATATGGTSSTGGSSATATGGTSSTGGSSSVGACNTVVQRGSAVSETNGTGPMEAAVGGTFLDGTYKFTQHFIYSPGEADANVRTKTIVLSGNRIDIVESKNSDPELRISGTFTTSGTTLTMTANCPITQTALYQYTVIAGGFRIVDTAGQEVQVYEVVGS